MNKITLILIVVLVGNLVNAQRKSKQEVVELMAEDTCKCISNKKIDKAASTEQKEMALGLCLFESFNAHKSKKTNQQNY